MDIQHIVAQKIDELIGSGTIEKVIEENIEKTVQAAIQGALKEYSEFGNLVRGKVAEAVKMSTEDIDLPTYNKLIAELIQSKFTTVLQEQGAAHLSSLIDELIVPRTEYMTMTQLGKLIKTEWRSVLEDQGLTIEIRFEAESKERITIEIIHPKYDWESIKLVMYRFGSATHYHIGYLYANSTHLSGPVLKKATTVLDGLHAKIYQLYAQGTLFEHDDDLYDIDLYD